jgi:hypothetical protein
MTATQRPRDSWLDRNNGLLRIVGARLSSVQFVLNYLILGFDEKGGLTSLVWPEAIRAGRSLKMGEAGYRDRLCELIEKVVTGAAIDSDDTITIQLGDDDQLKIPLSTYAGSGERAILTGSQHYLRVF